MTRKIKLNYAILRKLLRLESSTSSLSHLKKQLPILVKQIDHFLVRLEKIEKKREFSTSALGSLCRGVYVDIYNRLQTANHLLKQHPSQAVFQKNILNIEECLREAEQLQLIHSKIKSKKVTQAKCAMALLMMHEFVDKVHLFLHTTSMKTTEISHFLTRLKNKVNYSVDKLESITSNELWEMWEGISEAMAECPWLKTWVSFIQQELRSSKPLPQLVRELMTYFTQSGLIDDAA